MSIWCGDRCVFVLISVNVVVTLTAPVGVVARLVLDVDTLLNLRWGCKFRRYLRATGIQGFTSFASLLRLPEEHGFSDPSKMFSSSWSFSSTSSKLLLSAIFGF